ncbi:hypothetical protein BGZ98_006060 [Dissophora globulifera]|nr:hypothetical protein BGZ98_006060 [Dissophora globulifera]
MPPSYTTQSILDVPEICSIIARYLAPADLAVACRVSRGCFLPFASALWRSIESKQWTSREFWIAVPRYLHFVRQLRCPLSARTRSVDFGLQFTRLVLFHAPLMNDFTISIINNILRRNPNIEDLYIQCDFEELSMEDVTETMRVLVAMKKLTKLAMIGFYGVLPNTLDFLLDRLPKLEALHLNEWGYEENPWLALDLETGHLVSKDKSVDGQRTTHQPPPSPTPSQSQHQQQKQQLPVPRTLRTLRIGFSDCPFETTLKVASYSPLLNRLQFSDHLGQQTWPMRFTQQLLSFCPRLDELDLSNTSLQKGRFKDLLTALPRLRRLSVRNPGPSYYKILSYINKSLPVFGTTLEEVDLDCGKRSYQDMSTCREIFIMLASFPKLRKVHLNNLFVPAEDLAGSDMTLDYRNRVPVEDFSFACKDLEVLELIIQGPDDGWAPKELLDWDNDTFHDMDDLYDSDESDDDFCTTQPSTPPSTSPPVYELYETVMEKLCMLPKLKQSGLRFSYQYRLKKCVHLR